MTALGRRWWMGDRALVLIGEERFRNALPTGAIVITSFRALGDALGIVGALEFVIPCGSSIEFINRRRSVIEWCGVNAYEATFAVLFESRSQFQPRNAVFV